MVTSMSGSARQGEPEPVGCWLRPQSWSRRANIAWVGGRTPRPNDRGLHWIPAFDSPTRLGDPERRERTRQRGVPTLIGSVPLQLC